jgi:hypothetical protein
MFNDLVTSSSVAGQLPSYLPSEYPKFVEFLKDYYRFLETNSNPLDLINGLDDLIDIDTYSGVDLTARLKTSVSSTAKEIIVRDHVNFPATNGLLKIDDEVIFYKTREHIEDGAGISKLTVFSGCVRGYTYNSLTTDSGFVPNIKTEVKSHSALSTVYNQSYAYILYFLDQIRNQYLTDFPKNVLENNLDKVNINVLVKNARDFYLRKGTPQGIDFYFKFLFQDDPEITNYSEFLVASSDATYQNKQIIRIEPINIFNVSEMLNNSFVQQGNEFPVLTVENVFSESSQINEIEIANSNKIIPTVFTILTSPIRGNKMYVDSTYGFPDKGALIVNRVLVEYSSKESNYFNLTTTTLNYSVGDRVYDVSTLAQKKDDLGIYFVVYAGVNGFQIDQNYTYYQAGDIGYVRDTTITSEQIISSWRFNDVTPLNVNYEFLTGVTSIYYTTDEVYLQSSSIPYYSIDEDYVVNNNIVSPTKIQDSLTIIEDAKLIKKFPRYFKKQPEGFKISTTPNSPVGILRDGTALWNWKSNEVIKNGSIKAINILDGGDFYNVENPPTITIDAPVTAEGVSTSPLATSAEANLIVNGQIKEVYVINGGAGYPKNTVISVRKKVTDTVYTGDNFREAILKPIVVKGKITKVRVIDPGKGYTQQPDILISPNNDADMLPETISASLKALVAGPIGQIELTNPGSFYNVSPGYRINSGTGGTGIVTVENGKIINAQVVNGGQNYNSPPNVRVIDSTGEGYGANIISRWNPVNTQIEGFDVINTGINYSAFGTSIEVVEGGSGLRLEIVVSEWRVINNFSDAISNNYYVNNGGYLHQTGIIQDSQRTRQDFVNVPYVQYTSSIEVEDPLTGELTKRLLFEPNGRAHIPGVPLLGLNSYDELFRASGQDLLDEGNFSFEIPFSINFGSTSSNPSGFESKGYLTYGVNGVIGFSQSPAPFSEIGWATEQLTPTSIGPSIQVGRDDLVLDELFITEGSTVDPNTNQTKRVIIIRFESFHWDRQISKTKPFVYEILLYENLLGENYDNEIIINIIENLGDSETDDQQIAITYADDDEYEFIVPATSNTSYRYVTSTIESSEAFTSKIFTILGAPKQLQLPSESGISKVNFNDSSNHSPIIGWALDGAPIYGPYGYRNPLEVNDDQIVQMTSGWVKLTESEFVAKGDSVRITSPEDGGLSNYPIGYFEQDYRYTLENNPSLDENNGRFCVTPEFPNGVYAYFMTINPGNKTLGYPYFVGPAFAGYTDEVFNTLDVVSLNNLNPLARRYVRANSNVTPKALDTGKFIVESIPTSIDATVDSIAVLSGGSRYRIGDVVNFSNQGTDGTGVAAYVSVLKGQSVSNVSKTLYDYLEYYDENIPFISGSTIKTTDGWQAEIYSINQSEKSMYLTNVSGTVPSKNEVIYDTNLTIDVSVSSEISGNPSTSVQDPVITTAQPTAELKFSIGTNQTYFAIENFVSCSITDFQQTSNSKVYIKINDEYMRVIQVLPGTPDYIIVERGYRSIQQIHNAQDLVKLMVTIDVYDSSLFIIDDILKIDNEIFKVIDIGVQKFNTIQSTKIVNGSGTSGGNIYYLFVTPGGIAQTAELQTNSTPSDPGLQPSQDTVRLNAGGDIEDLIFDTTSTVVYDTNPLVQIWDSANYSVGSEVPNTSILASVYKHTLVLERAIFDTVAATHNPRTPVYRLRYINAKVNTYEEDRIICNLSAQNNLLVQGDPVSIFASTKSSLEYTIRLNGTTVTIIDNNGNTLNSLLFYEGSTYKFIIDSNSESIDISFFSFSEENTKQREYFDVEISKTFSNQTLTEFTIKPDSSDLTNLVMRLKSLGSNLFADVSVKTIPEPINGSYTVVNSNSSFFEIYTKKDPLDNLINSYNSNTILYTTTSANAEGSISNVTLTSGGYNYSIVPQITGIQSRFGNSAVLEARSQNIGSVRSIKSINSGYGYSSNKFLKPNLVFPRISKIFKNFIVTGVNIDDSGEGYLFEPRVIVTGGSLGDGDPNHARINAIINNEKLLGVEIEYSGVGYSTAPAINIEKYYYVNINATGEITFKFNFKKYIQDNDAFYIRAYYEDANQNTLYVTAGDGDVPYTFYAFLGTSTLGARETLGSTVFVNPNDYITIPNNAAIKYYELILIPRKAQVTARINKSNFINGEKVIINSDRNDGQELFGFVSNIKGWQSNNSILRIENYNYEFAVGDTIKGLDSEAFGIISESFGVDITVGLSAAVDTPKQFLNTKSFLGLNTTKLQDSFRYQKYAYEIGTNIPLIQWKENYSAAAHPAGHKFFAKTNINSFVVAAKPKETRIETKSVISTNVANIVRMNQKYNFFIARNQGLDEVEVINRSLTDIKEVDTSVVAAFEDISDQFNGVDNSFELKVINPIKPTNSLLDGDGNIIGEVDNYIQDYDADQMVVILDNIIQTYGTAWDITDSDKVFYFQASENIGESLPENETLTYRQFNENNLIKGFNTTVNADASTFSIVDVDNNLFSSLIYTNINQNNWLVFVDGAIQLNSSFTISGTNGGELSFGVNIPKDSQISARYIDNLLKNEFTSSSYSGGSLVLANKPSITSKESYFVFVDGILLPTSDYSLDANNDIIFNFNFSYDSLIVCIDNLGVSLESSTHNVVSSLYRYKINDGQVDIPIGFVVSPNQYMVDIAGVTQTPEVSYNTITSGTRKINFFEPPQRYVGPDNITGKQFIGLLYQRKDADGSLGTVPNYQFDDVSKNVINIKNNVQDFVVDDAIIIDRGNGERSSGIIVDAPSYTIRKIVETGYSSSLPNNSSFTIVTSDVIGLEVGDRVQFDASFNLTRVENDELEISAIDTLTNTITITNISGNTLVDLTIANDISIKFSHNELIATNLITNVPDREQMFVPGDTLLSGIVSSEKPGVITSLNEPRGLLSGELEFTVDDASGFAQNDYLLISNNEVIKVSSINGNVITSEIVGTRATATFSAANISGGALTGIATITNPGQGYYQTPNVIMYGGGGKDAVVKVEFINGQLKGNATMVNVGSNYTDATITVNGGGGTGGIATPTIIGGQITQIELSGGTGYTSIPQLVIKGDGQDAEATASFSNLYRGEITQITVSGGSGYTSAPTIIIDAPDRAQLGTSMQIVHGDGASVEKIIPKQFTVSKFTRGFDGDKTNFVLKENGVPIYIQADKDIFVIVNGILQKRGLSYFLQEFDPDGTFGTNDEYTEIQFEEPPKDGTPFNCFYVGETIGIQDISSEFNGSDVVFDLRSSTGEIFSLVSKSNSSANISANLLLFIDGVYQIPSTSDFGKRREAYPDSLSSFKLLGSVIEFTSPPKSGSSFEGYIYIGSSDDYRSENIDAQVESDDIIVQYNEFEPRRIINVTSATTMTVGISKGQKITTIPQGVAINDDASGWWKADLIKGTGVRESLRTRRTIVSSILSFGLGSPYPLVGKTLLETSITEIQINKVSSDFPTTPDDDSNLLTFIIPYAENDRFPERCINATYTTFVPRNLSISGNDELRGVKIAGDLPFNQIVQLASNSLFESFNDEIQKSIPNSDGDIDDLSPYVLRYNNNYRAQIINWDSSNQYLYVKLYDTAFPIQQNDFIQSIINPTKSYEVITDNLINEYQTLDVPGKTIKIIYNF